MTLQDIQKAHNENTPIIVTGRKYGNDVGKGLILDPDYKGFPNKQGALVDLFNKNTVCFVSYKNIELVRSPLQQTKKPQLDPFVDMEYIPYVTTRQHMDRRGVQIMPDPEYVNVPTFDTAQWVIGTVGTDNN